MRALFELTISRTSSNEASSFPPTLSFKRKIMYTGVYIIETKSKTWLEIFGNMVEPLNPCIEYPFPVSCPKRVPPPPRWRKWKDTDARVRKPGQKRSG